MPVIVMVVRLVIAGAAATAAEIPARYRIDDTAPAFFRGRDAHRLVRDHLEQHPKLLRRLTDPAHRTAAGWGYDSQVYRYHDAMLHLVAVQVKAMAERMAIDDLEDAFDPQYGVGSKYHKDKGTMNDVFSIWGHPARDEILQGSRASVAEVYHLFRLTVKNDLIGFARRQPLAWHQQPVEDRVVATLQYLRTEHPAKTESLSDQLQAIGLDLETLVDRIIRSKLIS